MTSQNIKKGLLLVVSGPSGVGKGTVVKRLLKKDPDFRLSVSFTTRKPRLGEVDGEDYHFVSESKFQDMIANSEFLEYAQYCGNYYGTSLAQSVKSLEEGSNVILEIEVQGGAQVRRKLKSSLSVFICPPSLASLKERIVARGLDSESAVSERIKEARKELAEARKYDYVVVNESVDLCAENIIKIVQSEHMKSKNMAGVIDGVLEDG